MTWLKNANTAPERQCRGEGEEDRIGRAPRMFATMPAPANAMVATHHIKTGLLIGAALSLMIWLALIALFVTVLR